MEYSAFFFSSYGYNSNVRIGKIYKLSSRETIRYLLTVHRDLIDKSFWIRQFISKVKIWSKKISLARKITSHHLILVKLGYKWNQIFYMIENKIIRYI